MAFVKDIELLMIKFNAQKMVLVRYVTKNFIENKHYTIEKNNVEKKTHGGNNKITYLLTEECFELISNSYNMRNRYITSVSSNIKCVNVAMCIENSTVGFIANSFDGIVKTKRQQKLGRYNVDLFFPEYKLIIECDENGHIDRDANDEKIREEFLIGLGNTVIRFNPSENGFDLSNVLKKINLFIFRTNQISQIIMS